MLNTNRCQITCLSIEAVFRSYETDFFDRVSAGQGHVFLIDLAQHHRVLQKFTEVLNASERDRAQRYYQVHDRERFVICRGWLKILLSTLAQERAQGLEIGIGLNKKPFLPFHPQFHFNVAHTRKWAVIGISNAPIGVDVEQVGTLDFVNGLAPKVLGKKEMAHYIKAADKPTTFTRFWTRKEALLKGTGKGVDDYIADVPCVDGKQHCDREFLRTATDWEIHSFSLFEKYMASVATTVAGDRNKTLSFVDLKSTDLHYDPPH